MRRGVRLLVSVVMVLCLLSSFTVMGAESIIPSNAFSNQTEFDKYWSNTNGSAVSATFADNVVTLGKLNTAANGWGGASKPKANIEFDSYIVEADIKIKGADSVAGVAMVGFVVNLPADFNNLDSEALSESCQAVRISFSNHSYAKITNVMFGTHKGVAGDFATAANTEGKNYYDLTFADKADAEDWYHVKIEVKAGEVKVTLDNDETKVTIYRDEAWTSLNGGFSFYSAGEGHLSVKNLTIKDASAPAPTESASATPGASATPSATPTPGQTPNQPTGDSSMIVFTVAAVVCAGALVVIYKKRHCKA